MALTFYTYSVTNDFPNDKVNISSLTKEINSSNDIIHAIDHIDVREKICDIFFKDELSSAEQTVLDGIVAVHTGEVDINNPPTMDDGRPIIRADSRPLNTVTYFAGCGDSTGIGDGTEIVWDFSNDDDLYTGSDVPSGFKAKQLLVKFNCPVYLKDGKIWFYDAPWGQYISMDIAVPVNTYYPNPAGSIPASALGLSGSEMYANSGGEIVSYLAYVQKQKLYRDCLMGDPINSEGASYNPLPVGWYVRIRVFTPDSDNVSKGHGRVEVFRCHGSLLPGMTLNDLGH